MSPSKPRARVEIDLNARTPEGYVPAFMPTNLTVSAGEPVTVFEPEDQVAAAATVVEIDAEYGIVYLEVNWATLADDYELVPVEPHQATR